jgi:hypothetical protein
MKDCGKSEGWSLGLGLRLEPGVGAWVEPGAWAGVGRPESWAWEVGA